MHMRVFKMLFYRIRHHPLYVIEVFLFFSLIPGGPGSDQ